MSSFIIGLDEWFSTAPGRYLLEWERERVDGEVCDIFGYHALQLGLTALDGLQCNRMPYQWLANDSLQPVDGSAQRAVSVVCDFAALPFPASSLDLVVLPHTLEFCADPHAALREVERVLVPEGKVVITGFNPNSLWGMHQRRSRIYQRFGLGHGYLPDDCAMLGFWRLRDWLHLLSFEVEEHAYGCYRPALNSAKWLQRFHWLDAMGERWWPIFGASYFVVAVKRVRGMRLLGTPWRAKPARAAKPVSIAHFGKGHNKGGHSR